VDSRAIRPARPEDWATISALLANAQLPTEGARESLQHFFVAHEGPDVLGCAGLERCGEHGLLRSVAVREQHRGQALAQSLTLRVIDLARSLGLAELHLLTTTASPYFLRFGFHAIPRADAPAALGASAEFQGACPASAELMRLDLSVRIATPQDAAAIAAIYAPVVTGTTISFELDAPTVDEMRVRLETTLPRLPWLVSLDEDGQVDGYAYAGKHRERPAYQWSVDCTVYVREDRRGRGVGRRLYRQLLGVLKALGYHQAYAGIAMPNAASIALHTAAGFEPVGTFREVGYKFGAWRDVGWWQCRLRDDAPERAPRSFM